MVAGARDSGDGYTVRVGWRDLAHLPGSATGEMREVAGLLDRLPGWHTVHAVPLDGRPAVIDHLTIGPGGALAIGSRENPDAASWTAGIKFLLLAQRRPYVSAAAGAARRAAALLGAASGSAVTVTAVLAVPDRRKEFHVHFADEGVHVVGRRHLAAWIEGLPALLEPGDAEALHRLARRSDTWH